MNMKLRPLLALFFVIGIAAILTGCATPKTKTQTAAVPATKKKTAGTNVVAVPYPDPPAVLPGNGLARHVFIYTGEWDTRKTNATFSLGRGGKGGLDLQIPAQGRVQ